MGIWRWGSADVETDKLPVTDSSKWACQIRTRRRPVL
jgi:hypothetical protein